MAFFFLSRLRLDYSNFQNSFDAKYKISFVIVFNLDEFKSLIINKIKVEKDYSKYPTLIEVSKGIEKLKKNDWPIFKEGSSVEEYIQSIEEIIFNEFNFFPNILRKTNSNEFQLGFFRVRELDSFNDINLIAEHNYPPIMVTKLGRCNFPKHPVFYCSDNPLVALMEVIRENNFAKKNYCISSWELVNGNEDLVFQNFLHTELDERNPFDVIRQSEMEMISISLENSLNDDQKAGFLLLIKFLHDSFITSNNYFLSASLAHRAFFSKKEFSTDILIYPSIQTQRKGTNMAINPRFVDSSMQLKYLFIVDVEENDLDGGEMKINFTKYATNNGKGFDWKDINPKNEDYKKIFRGDFSGFTKEEVLDFNMSKREIQDFDIQ